MTVELVARRQPDLDQGYADYHVYAGSQIVGRIYQATPAQWCWALNSLMIDSTAGAGMSGYAASMEEARQMLRPAFDRWLTWALAISPTESEIRPARQEP